MLCDGAGMSRALFLNGGSEAIESAIKVRLARPFGFIVDRQLISL